MRSQPPWAGARGLADAGALHRELEVTGHRSPSKAFLPTSPETSPEMASVLSQREVQAGSGRPGAEPSVTDCPAPPSSRPPQVGVGVS